MKLTTLLILIGSLPYAITSLAHPFSSHSSLSVDEQFQREMSFQNCIDQTEKSNITPSDVLYSDDPTSTALYIIKKQHDSGAGGGLVYKVIPNPNVWGDNGQEEVRLLKIFPYTKKSWGWSRHYNGISLKEANRERLNLCVMTELDKQMHTSATENLDLYHEYPSVYPLYDNMGMTYIETHSKAVPFIVTDYVIGKPLSHFYFDLDVITLDDEQTDKQPESMSLSDKSAYSTFLQLLVALKTSNEKYGFQHYDLHPGNIIISDEIWPEDSALTIEHPIDETSIEFDLSGTPKVKIIDLGTAGIGKKHQFTKTDDKFLDRKITKSLALRAKSSTFKYYILGNRVNQLTPDLSMWYILANHVIENETTLDWSNEALGEFICQDYNSCLAGYLDRMPQRFIYM